MSCSFRKCGMQKRVLCKHSLKLIIAEKSSSIFQLISQFAVNQPIFFVTPFLTPLLLIGSLKYTFMKWWLWHTYLEIPAHTHLWSMCFMNDCVAGGVYCWFSPAISWVLVVNSLFTFTFVFVIVLSIRTWTWIYVYIFFSFFSFQRSPLFMYKGCGALLYNQW